VEEGVVGDMGREEAGGAKFGGKRKKRR